MRHRSKKIKIRLGIDANKMLLRKLMFNFFKSGKITTTQAKARILKTSIEKVVEKAKEQTESNKNYLLSNLNDKVLVKTLFETVGPIMKNRVGGYVSQSKLHERESDGTLMVRLEWISPVVEVKEKGEGVGGLEVKEGLEGNNI